MSKNYFDELYNLYTESVQNDNIFDNTVSAIKQNSCTLDVIITFLNYVLAKDVVAAATTWRELAYNVGHNAWSNFLIQIHKEVKDEGMREAIRKQTKSIGQLFKPQ